jgi:hypothetical protein
VKASLATASLALLLVLTGCSDDGGGGGGGDDDTSAETTEAPSQDLSSYDTVAALNDDLAAGGIECNLEYEGLRDDEKEQSICTIEGSQAFLTIWFDESAVQAIVAPEGAEPPPGVAYGANWTIELTPPTPATATAIAEAAGGTTT